MNDWTDWSAPTYTCCERDGTYLPFTLHPHRPKQHSLHQPWATGPFLSSLQYRLFGARPFPFDRCIMGGRKATGRAKRTREDRAEPVNAMITATGR